MCSPPRTVLRTLPVVPNGTRHHVPSTPRKHKTPAPDRLLGVKPLKETLQEIQNKTRERLKLNFNIDDWQGELIRRLRQGYDTLMIAGTGYGKSIIFEALAALNKSKIDIVICPLKALERDQVWYCPTVSAYNFNAFGRLMKPRRRDLNCDGQREYHLPRDMGKPSAGTRQPVLCVTRDGTLLRLHTVVAGPEFPSASPSTRD
ncbi:hypothetical protein B0H10DRAFT_2086097 [Mycena sp. CBHHK59/15]|nr:hypothetical protein B0H10DRAFT_2086097 [Mycena sp. CBHHK59/15]